MDRPRWYARKNEDRVNDKSLQILIGVLAIVLAPVVWGITSLYGLQPTHGSVSHYYYSASRDYFEGVMFFVGVFLVFYKGHQVLDNVYTTVLGVLALGVASFPCALDSAARAPIGTFQLPSDVSDTVHLSSAVTFFILLTFYLLLFFTRTDAQKLQGAKLRRNVVYWVCGGGMIVLLLVVLGLMLRFGPHFNDTLNVMYWFEFGLLVLFGFAWLVKSGVVPGLRD